MSPRLAAVLFAAACLALPVSAVSAADEAEVYDSIESMHGNADGFFEILSALQDAIVAEDPGTIAGYAFYPLTVHANGETYDVENEQDLVDNFDTLVMPETRDAIASQEAGDLIVTSEGVGLGNGALWLTNTCLDDGCAETQWGILSINN